MSAPRMENDMLEKEITRLALDTPQDMFEKLKWEEERLVESWSIYDSFNFIVTAHHLYVDWLKPESASAEEIARKLALPQGAKDVFRAVIDVSNGSKHWKMTNRKSLEEQVIVKMQRPVIGCWFAYYENKPMAYFDFSGYSLSMAELSAFVARYFDWIFSDEGLPFPAELTTNLEALRVPTN